MENQKKKFVLAEASLDEVSKQLKINLFSIVVLVLLLGLNLMYFFKEKNFFSSALILLVIFFLYFMAKSRDILKIKQQEFKTPAKIQDKV